MRPHFFGQFLLGRALVTAPQLLAAVEYQERHNAPLGEQAIAGGLLTREDVERIRHAQTQEDLFFGEAAIRLGLLSPVQVRDLLSTQKDGHLLLGDALVDLGYLQRPVVDKALEEFRVEQKSVEPEVVELPDGLPFRDVAVELFAAAHRLLRRHWNLENRADRVRVERDMISLSDRNARVELSGAVETVVFVCVPHHIAAAAAGASEDEDDEPPSDEEMDRCVRDFCSLLCENLRSVLAEQGQRIALSAPRMLFSRASIPPGLRASVVPFFTHRGQILVGMTH